MNVCGWLGSQEFLGHFGGISAVVPVGVSVFFYDEVVHFGVELFPVVFADFAELHKVQKHCQGKYDRGECHHQVPN